jgi:hypothetical protein
VDIKENQKIIHTMSYGFKSFTFKYDKRLNRPHTKIRTNKFNKAENRHGLTFCRILKNN